MAVYNEDLFYDYQLSQDSLCWRLELNGNLMLKGLLSDIELGYSMENSYSDNSSDYDKIGSSLKTAQGMARTGYVYAEEADC